MEVLSRLNFKGAGPVLEEISAFPENPADGELCLLSGIVYVYTTLAGLKTWYPLSNESAYFVHKQGLASTTWTVQHNLETTNFIFFVYDQNGNLMQTDYTPIDDNSFALNFTVARKGKVVVFVAAERYSPRVATTNLVTKNLISEDTGENVFSFLSNGDIQFNGNLIPTQNETFNIGSVNSKIKDLYVSANTIHLGENTKIQGTSISVDAGLNPSSADDVPTLIGSKLIAKPFTYSPNGTATIIINPSIEFQNDSGQSYPISFISTPGEEKFSFDSPNGAGQAIIVAKSIETDGIQLDGYDFGVTEFKVDNGLRVDGNVKLGYDNLQTITMKSPVLVENTISLSSGATIGDGNDDVTVNVGSANVLSIIGNTNINNNSIKNVGLPVESGDATNKEYVDSLVTGLDMKQSVKAMADYNVTLSGTQVVDDVNLVEGDRVLLTGQTNATENGIYIVGTPWKRSSDADNSPANEVSGGMYCFVSGGTEYSDTGWTLSSPKGNAILGSDDLIFAKFTNSVIPAADILTKLKTVDGSGSGLDADKLDGIDSISFFRNNVSNIPSSNDSYDLGSANSKFKEVHATTFYGTSTSAQLADLAELYSCENPLPAGTVVTIPEDDEFDIDICDVNDIPFGIISDAPGFVLDNGLEQGVPIALTGKTLVLIKGPIKKGQAIALCEAGIASATEFGIDGYILGRALETKKQSDDETSLIKCVVKSI